MLKSAAVPTVLAVLLAVPCAAALAASVDRRLADMEQQVMADPHAALQQLAELGDAIAPDDRRRMAAWYLRKAQAENFLFQYDEFEQSIEQGGRLLDRDADPTISNWYAIYRCIIVQRRGEYAQAVACFSAVMAGARKVDDARALVFALQESAYTRSLNEDYEAALEELKRAYGIAAYHADEFLTGITEESLGAVYGYMGDYQRSIDHNQRALEIYQRLGYRAYESGAIYGLASTHRYREDWQQALDYYRRFDDMFAAYSDSYQHFMALYGYAMTYTGMGECAAGLAAVDEALAYPGLTDYKFELYKKQARCLVATGDVTGARAALENAMQLYRQIPDLDGTRWQLEVKQTEAVVLAAEGRFEHAYRLLDEYHREMSQRTLRDAEERLAVEKGALDRQLGDWELQLLRKQQLLDTEKIRRQQQQQATQKYINLLWGLVACAFIAFIYWQGQMAKRFRELSYRDPLTQLYNRRFVFEVMEDLIQRSSPDKAQLALILMDIDEFKAINDRYGHPVGDRALRQLAALTINSLRHSDTVGRIGGEEFLIILPRGGEEQCRAIADRLRLTVAGTPMRIESGEKVNFTISMGLARLRDDCQNAAELFSRADRALYAAKSRGKNMVVEYGEELRDNPVGTRLETVA